MPKSLANLFVVLLLGIISLGCNSKEEISTYNIARSTPPRTPLDPQEVAAQLDHMIAAIVPQKDKAWFFKVSGSAAAIDRQRESIHSFLKTVTLGETSEKPPTWTLPEGWDEKQATEMRLATLTIPDEESSLELAVSVLPLRGEWDEYLQSNVNRWLGQLKQDEVTLETVNKLAKEIEVQGAQATVFELVGLMKKPSAANPHAGIAGAPDISSSASPPAAQQAAETPPVKSSALDYETPEGWLPGRMSSMRKAAFRVTEGTAEGEVTVIDLPSSGGSQVADVEANMLRWAGQVGLTDLDGEAIGKLVEKTTVDGVEGSYAELIGPENPTRHDAMLVAMVEREGRVWFIKMSGPSAVVKAQKEAFRSFLESIHFK